MNQFKMLLVSYGIPVKTKEDCFVLEGLNDATINYVFNVMDLAEIDYVRKSEVSFSLHSSEVDKEKWVGALRSLNDSRTEMSFKIEELPLWKLDINIAGLIIQLNRLGLPTVFSCDGHGERDGDIAFQSREDAEKALRFLRVLGARMTVNRRSLIIPKSEIESLPILAAYLSAYVHSTDQRLFKKSFEQFLFEQQLEEILQIPGESGNEDRIRSYLIQELKKLGCHYTVDEMGNILAEKKFGSGPVILLNAHMDTVYRIHEEREIIKNGSEWRSSKGILGADDRSGITAIIMLLKNISRRTFSGTLKVIFTVEEETGLNGARAVPDHFLWNTEAAFVLDRRGSGDLVTHNTRQSFCKETFAQWLEAVANEEGFSHYKTVRGGSSDTAIWAKHGIDSVNISIGYKHEHTEKETLNVDDCFQTYELLKVYLCRVGEIRRIGRAVRRVK
ncbi:M20/M25/M40 family metallo-hydrolase [Jeotgalibacillus sp. R-1-5s-1]|uniref:M20/M25/M40 family metallo-hydrolase n=1 Tax=Jeotgalibacillus sp. R-1-5s-1 TaxID=2555897 RepID=UPI001069ADDB|nr:M20/M25/M40 family metallo-hydrolase [Jeotgalibacillus sp. R-1-5s-1]TFD99524.1 M20/M25/M40 family metallo-hydrolase [Jeotgalibacillus sp. R-1-5s-1]